MFYTKLISIRSCFSSPPDVPTHANDSTRQISAYSDQNGSFEDEEIDNEPCQPVDQMDSHYSIQSNEGIVGKASALYDFNGKISQFNIRL